MFKPAAKPVSTEGVGKYAIRFKWNDGTNWEFIRGSFCGMFARARSAGRCEQRRWDKVILCANSEILQEHIPGQLPLRTTGVLTERPGLTSRSGFLHAAAAAKRHKNAAQGASPG